MRIHRFNNSTRICRGGKEPVNLDEIMTFCREKSRGRITVNPLTTAYPSVVPCSAIHPQNESCLRQIVDTTLSSGQKAMALYTILGFVPLFLSSLPTFLQQPFSSFLKASWGCFRSTCFLSVLVGLLQVWTCGHRNLFDWDHKMVHYFGGLFCSTAILIEKKSRRVELGLFVFPRALSSLYSVLHKRGLVPMIPQGDILLFCVTMGGIMYFHRNRPEMMTPTLAWAIHWLFQ